MAQHLRNGRMREFDGAPSCWAGLTDTFLQHPYCARIQRLLRRDEPSTNDLDAPLFMSCELDDEIENDAFSTARRGPRGVEAMEGPREVAAQGKNGEPSKAQKYLQQLRGKASVALGRGQTEEIQSKTRAVKDEYHEFEIETAPAPARTAPQPGSKVWADDVTNRALAIAELTRGWDTRGKADPALSQEESYARFLQQEKEESEARLAQKEADAAAAEASESPPIPALPPPKIGGNRITGLEGPKPVKALACFVRPAHGNEVDLDFEHDQKDAQA